MRDTAVVTDLVGYLGRTGWQDTGRTWRGGGIWSLAGTEVLVPVDSDVRDYPERVADLVRVVADVEERPADDVLRSLRRPADDQVTLEPGAELTLDSGVQTLDGVRRLVRESARTVSEGPHVRFRGRETGTVTELLASTAIGPVMSGKSGFSLFLPSDGDGELRGREVTRQLHDMLTTASRAVRSGRPAALEDTVLLGVTVECCRVLAHLGGSDDEGFEFGFRWAADGTGPVRGPARVGFPAGSGSVLRSAGRRIVRNALRGGASAAGLVDGLHDEPGSEDRWRARVSGEVLPHAGEVRGRTIWLRFRGQETYDRTVERYHHGLPIRVEGELTSRDGRIELMVDEDGWTT
ncbi:hypothetical protein WIS52_21150 [Pseudonocardia nematodicida]|uniref:Uncharacterized protein n=1 Tax=Pseudonocardia nematodicida TaxID=1206997 RepID=A0ABV1KFM4_9PSEU